MQQGFAVVVLAAVLLLSAVVSSQEQDAEFVPGGATRRPFSGRPSFNFPGGRPQFGGGDFGGDEPGIVIVRLPSATRTRPSLLDILTRGFTDDNLFGLGGDNDLIPFYGIDRPGDNGDEPPQKLFPFPDFTTFTKPQRPTLHSFGGFDDFFNSFIPRLPQGPDISGFDFDLGNLPDDYNNQTHTVETIDGNRVEVNSTIKKDGNNFFQFHVVKFGPKDESSGSPQVPEDVDTSIGTDVSSSKPNITIPTTTSPSPVSEVVPEITTTPYEDFGDKLGRVKRSSLPYFITRYFGGKTTEAPSYITHFNSPSNHIGVNQNNPRHYETENESPALVDLSGDTRVNYLARNVESEALVDDVEVFDWDLVRDEARRNGFNNNLQSQPRNSASLRSHPMGLLSVMSEPITPPTVRSRPMKSQSISQQPTRSASLGLVETLNHHPQINHPLRFQSVRMQPMRSQQMQSQSLRLENSNPIPSPVSNYHSNSHPIRHQRHRSNL